jgi:steroid delta-isomerase-like uncharacterized protein
MENSRYKASGQQGKDQRKEASQMVAEDPEGVRAVVAMFRSGMPDLRVIIEDMIAEGDKVATRYTLEGTHEGELFGVPPTGQRLSIKSISVERVSDGKIREHWRITDTLDMMQQLGVIPMPEHA